MAGQYITVETIEAINKMLPQLKESEKVKPYELEELEKLKQKRNVISNSLEDAKKKYHLNMISKDEYEAAIRKLNICKKDLEILKKEVSMSQRNLYLRRLDFLVLITKVPIGKNYVEINGRRIHIDTLYQKFLENIVNENIELLRFKRQALSLIISYNKSHNVHSSKNEGPIAGDNLYDLKNKIESLKNTPVDCSELNFSKLTAEDLLSVDVAKLYDKLFTQSKSKK